MLFTFPFVTWGRGGGVFSYFKCEMLHTLILYMEIMHNRIVSQRGRRRFFSLSLNSDNIGTGRPIARDRFWEAGGRREGVGLGHLWCPSYSANAPGHRYIYCWRHACYANLLKFVHALSVQCWLRWKRLSTFYILRHAGHGYVTLLRYIGNAAKGKDKSLCSNTNNENAHWVEMCVLLIMSVFQNSFCHKKREKNPIIIYSLRMSFCSHLQNIESPE